MTETNINIEGCDHIPGVKKLFYVFKDSILSMAQPRHSQQWRISDIELLEDKFWGRIFFLSESAQFDEPVQDTENGDLYNLTTKGQLLSTDELGTTLFMALSRREIVLILEDEKGNKRVIGNQEKGVRLKISQTSSTFKGNIFGYSFSFVFVSDGPAYWFDGVMTESEDGGVLNPDAVLLDFEVNNVNEGQVSSALPTGVNLEDEDENPVVPISVSFVGNKRKIVLPAGPSGVGLHFITPEQWDSYGDYDIGDRVQSGWFNDMVNPPFPAVWSDLDYTSQYYHFLLKQNIRVGANATIRRFVDIDGLQEFPAVSNKELVGIDKHIGLAFYRRPQYVGTHASRQAALDYARTMNINVAGEVFDDWYMAGFKELLSILGNFMTTRAATGDKDPVTNKTIFEGITSNYNIQAAFTNNVFSGTNILGARNLGVASYQAVAATDVAFYIHKAKHLILEP